MTITVDRARVIAYRFHAHQLDRPGVEPADLAVLDLGIPDTPYGSAGQAVAARADGTPDLPLVWTTRGAPHLHRPADLPALATALWPLSDADAAARIGLGQIRQGAAMGVEAYTVTAKALRAVVRGPMSKGDVSTAVSVKVPAELTYACRSCDARHISGSVFQLVGAAAGVRIDLSRDGTWLAPLDRRPPVPTKAAGTDAFLAAYLRLHGPATLGEAAKYLDTTQTNLRPAWPRDLAEVSVEGRKAWIPADRADALRTAPEPDAVRLLPPGDPWLQARDRALIVPDRARQKELWRMLGNPGALLVDGEVAGTWRAKSAKGRLTVTVTPFGPLAARVRKAAGAEAERLAKVRGAADVEVVVAGG